MSGLRKQIFARVERWTCYWGERPFTSSYNFNNSFRTKKTSNLQSKFAPASFKSKVLISPTQHRQNTAQTFPRITVPQTRRRVIATMGTRRPAELKHPASSIRRSSAQAGALRSSVSQCLGEDASRMNASSRERRAAHYECAWLGSYSCPFASKQV